MPTRVISFFVAALMSVWHHVGWPVTEEVTPFTYSFGGYPLIFLGLYWYLAGRVGPGYWAILSASGAVFFSVIHFGPNAIEPPSDIIDLYEPRIIGWFAFAWVVVLVVALAASCVYETILWARERKKQGT